MLQSCFNGRALTAQEIMASVPDIPSPAPRTIVAIPVRDEEDRIQACLQALLHQQDFHHVPMSRAGLGIVLVLNNCQDRTAGIARDVLASAGCPFILADIDLPSAAANAGFARGLALDIAALWLERHNRFDGVLLTTDADSRVATDWMARNLAGLATGCGGVAGRVELEPAEEALLPQALIRRGAGERAYEQALLALSARLDPIAHDPWPNHWAASGASYGVTLGAYRAIGGLPAVASGEDRALANALLRADIPIRHDPAIVVITSARLEGRAPGGVADTMRMRCEDPDGPGDDALESSYRALRRFAWRARLRRWHCDDKLKHTPWHRLLRLPAEAEAWAYEPRFGTFWARIEAASPRLARVPLRPRQMPVHTAAVNGLLSVLGWPKITAPRDSPSDILAYDADGSCEQIFPMRA
jgi:hypothetical protein